MFSEFDLTYRLIYSSRAAAGMDRRALEAILASARSRNAQSEVSGLLVYAGGFFIQWLEGPRSRVMDVYQRILRDPRHTQVEKLRDGVIDGRRFASAPLRLHYLREEFAGVVAGEDQRRRRMKHFSWVRSADVAERFLLNFDASGEHDAAA